MTATIITTSPGFGRAKDLANRLAANGWTLLRGTIDIPPCTARSVLVTATPGANAVAVAEWALAHLFALWRNVVSDHASATSRGWDRRTGDKIAGATLGIVGLHVFASRETAGLVGAAQLAAMKPGATLANLSRGEVLDLDALQAAFGDRLAGAAIDTHVTEPPDCTHPIFANPHARFSPHSGADTAKALKCMGDMVIDDIETLLAGARPDAASTRKSGRHVHEPTPLPGR